MKALLVSLMILTGMNASAAVIKLSIFGKQMAPAAADFKNVNTKIGELITDYKLKKFEVLAYGIEGGFLACIEANGWIDVYKILWELNSVKVDKAVTAYDLDLAKDCQN